MTALESEALNQLINNLTDKKLKSSKDEKLKKPKNTNTGKKFCKAAVKYNTFGDAYRDIEKGHNVFCVMEELNGEITKIAYTQCSKTSQDGECYCHIHNRTIKNKNSPIKNYEDIIPSSDSDKTKWLLTLKDEFFENMGKRGANKKNDKNNHKLDENDPINVILRDKDPRKLALARICITKILKNDIEFLSSINIESNNTDKNIKKKIEKQQSNIDSLVDLLSTVKESNKKLDNESSNENSSDDDSSDDETNEKNITNEKMIEDNESESDSENESDSDEGVSCIQIITVKGKQLWFNEDSKMVYEPEDDDETEAKPMGELVEISEEFHTIIHNSKYYSVLNKIENKGKLVYHCVLTDKLFNKKFKHIGKLIKLKNKESKLEYF